MKNKIITVSTDRLNWRKINGNSDLDGIPNGALVVVRSGRNEFLATKATHRLGLSGFRQFNGYGSLNNYRFPMFMAAMPNGNLTGPWDGAGPDGWIDVAAIGGVGNLKQGNYELEGPWRENGYPYDTIHAFRYKSDGIDSVDTKVGHWAVAGGGNLLPEFFETAVVRVRKTPSWPDEWLHKMPVKEVSEEERLRQRVADLEAKLEAVARAAGKGGRP